MVERLIAWLRAWLRRTAVMSSRLHRVAGQWWSAGVFVASDRTSMRSEGGKAPRPTWPGRILQTGEPVCEIPGAPEADRLAVTGHGGRHPEIRRGQWGGPPDNQGAPESEGPGGGKGTGE